MRGMGSDPGKISSTEAAEIIVGELPVLADEIWGPLEKDLLHPQIGTFAQYTQARIDAGEREAVSQCYALALRLLRDGDEHVINAIFVSFLEHLQFEDGWTLGVPWKRDWARALLPVELEKALQELEAHFRWLEDPRNHRSTRYRCPTCAFDVRWPIASLEVSELALNASDDRFPGRSLLILREHAEDLGQLDPLVAGKFIHDAQRAGRALALALGVPRINYAILGNAVPHLHWHLIPRTGTDPVANKAPWEHPGVRGELPDAECIRLIERIRLQLPPSVAPGAKV
jgi:diadenosine tetraphosphate (Ap4A) HIT family hydrolase